MAPYLTGRTGSSTMSVGTTISGVGHTALIGWLILGWGLQSDPLPFEVTEVSIVSGAEFAALTQGVQPDQPGETPATPDAPAIDETPPAPEVDTPPEVVTPPEPVPAPAQEDAPIAPEQAPPPQADVTDTPPDVPTDVATLVTPPPSTDVGVSPRPKPRPAPRIAPVAIAPPPEDVAISDVDQTAPNPDAAPAEDVPEAEETTAQEESAPEIVTEAETPAAAPERSLRPQTRPNRPAAPASDSETATATAPAEDDATAAAVEAAVAAATEAATAPPQTGNQGGGELSADAKNGFLRQIGSCWSVGSAGTDVLSTVVTVGFSMTEDGRPDTNSIRLVSFTGGTQSSADIAFRIAKSALVRCTRDGYDLPRDQYETWRNIELTFNPERMRTR